MRTDTLKYAKVRLDRYETGKVYSYVLIHGSHKAVKTAGVVKVGVKHV